MNLRTRVLRGGVYLILRQGLGVVIGAVGVILLTRSLGPEAYGIYAAAFGIYSYLFNMSKWGVDVYLIRYEGEPQPQDYHQAFSLLVLLSLAGIGVALLVLPFIEWWVRLEGFGPVAMALFAVLPVHLLGLVPLARLERALNYRRVASIELSGQIALYVVALTLAYRGQGPWAPVFGLWVPQLLMSSLLYLMSGYRPKLHWEFARVRAMVGYGLGFSAADWIWSLRPLVNPLVVGRYAGAEAVGYVALVIRLVEQLGFVKAVTWRLSIAALARVQTDRARLVSAINEGMRLQVLALGGFLVAFSLVAPMILPPLLGSNWLPVLEVYPFIALGYLASTLFQLHSSVLYVLQRNRQVMIFHLVYIALFAGSALWLVPLMGFIGYGWAEVVALVSYIVIHLLIVKEVGKPNYRLAGLWMLAFALALFWRELGWVAMLGMVGVALWPETWRALGIYIRYLRKVRYEGVANEHHH